MKFVVIILFFVSCACFDVFGHDLAINEIMSANSSVIQDEDGDYSDWIELYNPCEYSIELEHYSLSDEQDEPNKWFLPDIDIAPGTYLLIFASGKDRKTGDFFHANFKIKAEGEKIYLSKNGINIDFFENIDIPPDFSYGRKPDGAEERYLFLKSSPGSANQDNITGNHLEFSHLPGYYTHELDIGIEQFSPGDSIYYTLDGSDPGRDDYLYKGPVKLYSKVNSPNVFSIIPTNGPNTNKHFIWKEPREAVYKANVIRACSYNKIKTSEVISSTYFIDPNIYHRYTFPIVSIITDSMNLFGFDKGIYVPGKYYDHYSGSFWGTGNFLMEGEEWERKAHIEFFETDGGIGFSQDIGIRIFGNGSRGLPEKSISLYARSEYGKSTIDYQVFPDRKKYSFKRLILRNSGQDFLESLFLDSYVQSLTKGSGLEYMDSRPAIVFINGEYWGIHNIRERYTKYYFEDYHELNIDSLDILELRWELVHGSIDEYYELFKYIENNDLSLQENYDYVAGKIDIDNFISYNIVKLFSANDDWPGNNVKYWKPRTPGAKWRWLNFDNDGCFRFTDYNSIHKATQDTAVYWPNPPWATLFLRKLLENKGFRDKFIDEYSIQMNGIYSVERLFTVIDEFVELYKPEMREHIARWNYPESYDKWLQNIDRIKEFIRYRPCYIEAHMKEKFALDQFDCGCDTAQIVEIIKTKSISLYPNPNNGVFVIGLGIDNIMRIEDIRILDITGREIKPNNIDFSSTQIKVDADFLEEGFYSVILKQKNEVIAVKKFIIVK